MNRRQTISALVLAGLWVPSFRAWACLWDSDTLRDEAKLNASDFDLVTGQFPHHGAGYYRVRIQRLTAAGEPTDYQMRNDLAVAHVRLEQWKEAQALLEKNLAAKPDDYFTLSNLGVLAKKQGNFAAAADWMAKAIGIKPEGHMGLGDWYVKALQYRAAQQAEPKRVPDQNFLGEAYADTFRPCFSPDMEYGIRKALEAPEKQAWLLKVRRLLENDQSFADGFLVMGDHLAATRDISLALLAYKRAVALGHPNRKELQRRIDRITSYVVGTDFDPAKSTYKAYTAPRRQALADSLKRSFDGATAWLEAFQRIEGEMAAKSGDQTLTPAEVEAEMARRGLKRFRP